METKIKPRLKRAAYTPHYARRNRTIKQARREGATVTEILRQHNLSRATTLAILRNPLSDWLTPEREGNTI